MIKTAQLFILYLGLISTLISCQEESQKEIKSSKPNIILVMADDLGYGDVGYNGNPILKTPCLDQMAKEGVVMNNFYAAAPVCSPTRASVITGRHPYRVGIPWAGDGAMPTEEVTLAEALKTAGYATAHFGKWHIGGLSKTIKQSEFPGGPTAYSPPWENGFDECYTTESMVPTYNPYYHVGGKFGSKEYAYVQDQAVEKGQKEGGHIWSDRYWTGPGQFDDSWPEGDDSQIIMNKSLDFIKRKAAKDQPFLSVIWFHTPHTPVVAGNEDRAQYADQGVQASHWYGAISAMDKQVGRLRKELKNLGIAENSIIWFCSDNGPSYIHNYNSTGGFRDKKASLYEGGIRVPGIIEWPAEWKHAESNVPAFTSDIYPTILAACGVKQRDYQPVLDGIDISGVLDGTVTERNSPLCFISPLPARLKKSSSNKDMEQMAVIGDRYKLISADNGETFQLYDLDNDPKESVDISENNSQITTSYIKIYREWKNSVDKSIAGDDYLK